MRVMSLKAWFLALCLMAAVPGIGAADQKLDPKLDATIGQAEAPHQLVIYYSPGCPKCLTFLDTDLVFILQGYVRDGRLLVVLRDIPSFFPVIDTTEEKILAAYRFSSTLSLNLHCYHRTKELQSFLIALDALIVAQKEHSAANPAVLFPYLPEGAAQQAFFASLSRRDGFDAAGIGDCAQGEIWDEIVARWDRNKQIFDATAKGGGVPALFIDGQRVAPKTTDRMPDVRRALLTTIGAPGK